MNNNEIMSNRLTKWLCWILICQVITVFLLAFTFVAAMFLDDIFEVLLKVIGGLGICFVMETFLLIHLVRLKSHIEADLLRLFSFGN